VTVGDALVGFGCRAIGAQTPEFQAVGGSAIFAFGSASTLARSAQIDDLGHEQTAFP
jgi:hypothetical protein